MAGDFVTETTTDRDPGTLRVLVTNDDGVDSPGLHALAVAVADAGYDVVVAAPDRDMSGTGASLGRLNGAGVDVLPHTLPGGDGIDAYAVAGPPGLCVLAGKLGAFGAPPDVVVSGINPGCNTGPSILHSGTVGAALSAANFGLSGVAVSIDTTQALNGRHDRHWDAAAELGRRGLTWVTAAPVGTVLNINLPDRPLDELNGARWAEPAAVGSVRSRMVDAPIGGRGRLQLELVAVDGEEPAAETDTALIRQGYVTVTALTGVQAIAPVEVEPIVGLVGGGIPG